MTASSPPENAIVPKVLRAVAGAPPEVYSPSDDTFLMLDVLAKITVEGKDVLDVGTGSGALALYCCMRGAHVTATDIEPKALEHAARVAHDLHVNLHVIVSDLFSNVTGHFDLITFNPPYLPSTQINDRTVDGGRQGEAVAERFLGELKNHLRSDGTSLLLMTNASDLNSLAERHSVFEFSTVASRRLFFEELLVLQLRFRDSTAR